MFPWEQTYLLLSAMSVQQTHTSAIAAADDMLIFIFLHTGGQQQQV